MDLEEAYDTHMKPFRDIVGCAFAVHNWFRPGLHEDTYEVGLKIELENLGYIVQKQQEFNVWYKGKETDKKFRMDLVVQTKEHGNIVLELKALDSVSERERLQLFNYMRLTKTEYGMLINFGKKKVYTERWRYDEIKNECERLFD